MRKVDGLRHRATLRLLIPSVTARVIDHRRHCLGANRRGIAFAIAGDPVIGGQLGENPVSPAPARCRRGDGKDFKILEFHPALSPRQRNLARQKRSRFASPVQPARWRFRAPRTAQKSFCGGRFSSGAFQADHNIDAAEFRAFRKFGQAGDFKILDRCVGHAAIFFPIEMRMIIQPRVEIAA